MKHQFLCSQANWHESIECISIIGEEAILSWACPQKMLETSVSRDCLWCYPSHFVSGWKGEGGKGGGKFGVEAVEAR